MADGTQTVIRDRETRDGMIARPACGEDWGYALFEQSLNAVVIVRIPDGMVLDANGSACHDLGYTRDELLQRSWPAIVDLPYDLVRVLASRVVDEQPGFAQGESVQAAITTKRGERRTIRLRCHTMLIGGNHCGLLIWQDITETARTAERIRQQEEELAHMARVGLMGELVTVLAHEVNQPVCAIISNAQAAQRLQNGVGQAKTAITEILTDIIADAKRAAEVLANLRTTLQRRGRTRRPENINDMIRQIEGFIRKDADRFDVRVGFDLGEKMPTVMVNRVEIQQVVLNLVRNAFEAIGKQNTTGDAVRIRTRLEAGDRVRVAVIDRGCGAPDRLMNQLFAPFFSTKRGGLGMGLSICKSIIDSHGGQIQADANDDGGMSFSFTLPAYRPTQPAATHKTR